MRDLRCSVCSEKYPDDDINFCTHRFPVCRGCCATGGHNEELSDIPDCGWADDRGSADRECDRYERTVLGL